MDNDFTYVEEVSFSGDALIAGMERFQRLRPQRLKGLLELVEADYFGCTLRTCTVVGKKEIDNPWDEVVLVYREYITDDIGMWQDERVHLKSFRYHGESSKWLAKPWVKEKGYVPLALVDVRTGYIYRFTHTVTQQRSPDADLTDLTGIGEPEYESYWS